MSRPPIRKPQPVPTDDSTPQTTVDLADDGASTPGALPHEEDQQTSSQTAEAGQDQTQKAVQAHKDAALGRPDTSSAPQLQRGSPADRPRKRRSE